MFVYVYMHVHVSISFNEHFKWRNKALTTRIYTVQWRQRDPVHCRCAIRYSYLKIPRCKSILGLPEMFCSLVIDEIKCFEGGHFTLEGDSLP